MGGGICRKKTQLFYFTDPQTAGNFTAAIKRTDLLEYVRDTENMLIVFLHHRSHKEKMYFYEMGNMDDKIHI